MSRRKTDRLAAVQTVFAARESRVAVYVRQCQQALVDAQSQLELLCSSRDEHSSALSAAAMSASQYANRAAFLGRLNTAIVAQQQVVAEARETLAGAREQLAARRQRTQAIEKVRDKRLVAARVRGDRREQSELDDRPRPPRERGA